MLSAGTNTTCQVQLGVRGYRWLQLVPHNRDNYEYEEAGGTGGEITSQRKVGKHSDRWVTLWRLVGTLRKQ